MTQEEFLRTLASMEFPAKYWDLCNRFPVVPGSSYSASKKEVLEAFKTVGVDVHYDSRDRSYEVESEKIGSMDWSALFVKQRSGPEFMITGVGPEGRVGSNFAVLAYDSKRMEEPGFTRSPFSGPPPYPRPAIKNPVELVGLLEEFIRLVREIKGALRERDNTV